MKEAPVIKITILMILSGAFAFAEDIILRLRPESAAPIITRITATEKVLLEAAPAGADSAWMQLELKIPFEGYVPAATLTKGLAIIQDTAVHVLPDANSDIITRAEDGDLYEIKRVSDEWATIRYTKVLTTYFRAGALPSAAPEPLPKAPALELKPAPPVLDLTPAPPVLDLTPTKPTHTPEPKALNFDPGLGIGQTSPEDLPPENVVWKTAPRSAAATPELEVLGNTNTPERPDIATPPYFEEGNIIVSPGDTQAREVNNTAPPESDQPLRLLTGTLVREIENSGPAYPIRLMAPDGRLIAYVDFSGIFIEDLSPYLNQRVFLRGQLAPVQRNSRSLVIFVRKIQLAH